MENKNPEICGKKKKRGPALCDAVREKKKGGGGDPALCGVVQGGKPALCGAVRSKKKKKKRGSGPVRRCAEKKKGGGPALCGAVQRGTGAVRRCAGKKYNFRLEFSFCGKRESGNSLFLESETPRILVLWKTSIRKLVENENSRFMQNENPRILVLWKTRIEEFFFLENQNLRILVLWKTRLREFSFYGKQESGDLWEKKKRGLALCDAVRKKKRGGRFRRCAALCGGGPALCGAVRGKKNIQVRILILWKTRIGEFSFSGKRDSKNSRFVENENSEICRKREFSFYAERESENSRFVENQN